MAIATQGTASNYLQRAPSPSGLADVVDLILDKGLVIDAYVRIAVIGIELITIDARIVIASVDTYLHFAEAVNRLDLTQTELASLASALSGYLARKASVLAQEKLVPKLREKGGAKAVAQEAVSAVAEKVGGDEESSRDAERRNRERRRNQRRQALEQSGSS